MAGGVGYAAIENSRQTGHGALSAWDGIWWAITTVTTVGYGDQYPVTAGGRLIAIAVMLVGIGFVAILTAAAAQRFMRAEREETTELRAVHERLNEVLEKLAALERR